MCGRVKLDNAVEEILKHFNLVLEKPETYAPSLNIAPGQTLPVVTSSEPNKLKFFKWGLLPSWAKDERMGYKMFNARVETLTEKPAYKNLINGNRCVIITNGFYEWKEIDGKKRPFTFKGGSGFTILAGLWDYNPNFNIHTCTVITCEPNSVLAGYHDRMPVIFNEEEMYRWLSGISKEEAFAMLKPYEGKIDVEDAGEPAPAAKAKAKPKRASKSEETTLDLFGE